MALHALQKKNKTIYWVSTILVSLMMLFSAYSYFTNDEYKVSFIDLGYPQYFRIELAIAKLLGAIVLSLPIIPARIKEWAYAGFTFTYISAIIAHIVNDDPIVVIIQVFTLLLVLLISYTYFHKNRIFYENYHKISEEK